MAKATEETEPRQVKIATYTSFRLQKRLKVKHLVSLPSAWALMRGAFNAIRRNWKVFAGIVILYGLLNLILVQGFSAVNLSDTKNTFDEVFSGNWGKLVSGFSLFAYMVSASGNNGSATAGVYQFILSIIVSLALIWVLRRIYAGHTARVRDAFYRGMTPLVPFLLVIGVIGLQLIPMAGGILLYSTVALNGLAVSVAEQVLWAVALFLLVLLSLYMISSSVFALYIVSLPDMPPMAALRSARKLVLHRRWMVMRKIILLPIVLVVFAGVIMLPLILFVTPVAPWVFFILSMALLTAVHSYLFALYRALL